MTFYQHARRIARKVLKHFPGAKLVVRRKYWGAREKWYSKRSAGIPVKRNCIMFGSFMGRYYSCSPRSVYEAMTADERFADWEFIWTFKNLYIWHYQLPEEFRVRPDGAPIPLEEGIAAYEEARPAIYERLLESDPKEARKYAPGARDFDAMRVLQRATIVGRGTDEYYDALARAKFWVTNSRTPDPVWPKEDQVLIQCWHGTPLKRMAHDVDHETGGMNSIEDMQKRYSQEASRWKHLVTPSAYATEHIMTAFGLDPNDPVERGKVLEIGYPRNDRVVQTCSDPARLAEAQRAIKERLGIPEEPGVKYLLYAPTWRDDDHVSGRGWVQEMDLDFDLLYRELGDEWRILFRTHYFVTNKFDFSKYNGFIVNATDASDINDLYIIADALMTDYSSVFYDYACTARPLYFYWPDYEHYARDVRGFYMDPASLPGPHCMTSEEVVSALKGFDSYEDEYGEAYAAFRKTFCPHEDGKAAARLADVIARES